MKYQTSHLDLRIVGGLRAVLMPNDVLTKEKADRFSPPIGQLGYATECLMDLQSLGEIPQNKLFRLVEVKYGSPFPFRCCVVGNSAAESDFSFFLPANQVAAYSDKEESIARPFTIAEFEDLFDIGDKLCLRVDRSPRCLVGQVPAYRCIAGDDESLEVLISGLSIWLKPIQWLFEHVEYSLLSGGPLNWRPFGTEGV